MKRDSFELLKELIRIYNQLLEEERDTILKICSLNLDSFSDWESVRICYNKRIKQINEILDINHDFLKTTEAMESVYFAASPVVNSFRKLTTDVLEKAAIFDGQVSDTSTASSPSSHIRVDIHENIAPPPTLDKVEFAAVAPKSFNEDEHILTNIVMYEKEFRWIVDEMLSTDDIHDPRGKQESRSGMMNVSPNSKVKITLTSSEMPTLDETLEKTWAGEFLVFEFAIRVPSDVLCKECLFTANVYINNVIATHLHFAVRKQLTKGQRIEMRRRDIRSAFMSYASQDRGRVASIV